MRLKSVQLILSKHRPPPLREAHKQSDPHYIHRHTHNHTYMHSLLRPVWFGNSERSLRGRGRREGEEKRTFPGSSWVYLVPGNSADCTAAAVLKDRSFYYTTFT